MAIASALVFDSLVMFLYTSYVQKWIFHSFSGQWKVKLCCRKSHSKGEIDEKFSGKMCVCVLRYLIILGACADLFCIYVLPLLQLLAEKNCNMWLQWDGNLCSCLEMLKRKSNTFWLNNIVSFGMLIETSLMKEEGR